MADRAPLAHDTGAGRVLDPGVGSQDSSLSTDDRSLIVAPSGSSQPGMARAVSMVGPRGRYRGLSSASALVLLGLLALSLAWSLFVFADSQVAYVCATATSAVLAIWLASIRSQALVVLLVAEVGLLGTDANGELAQGTPLLGSFRLLDITVAAALIALAASAVRESRALGGGPPESDLRRRIASPGRGLETIFAAVVLWALALWLAHGHPLDQITRADVRVVGLGVAMWVIARTCKSSSLRNLPAAIAALGPAISAKAVAIYVSGLWVIGSNDRLQASADYASGHTRIILVGGDTILILTPAVALLALSRYRSIPVRLWLYLSVLSSFVGLLISGTRSGLIVAVLTLVFAAILEGRRPIPAMRRIAVWLPAVALLVGGLIVTGTMTRFVTPDPPHVGVNFRADELRSVFQLPTNEIVFGQGIGGRFVGKDVNGLQVITGWSHTFPAWIVLKIGMFGLVFVSALGLASMWRRFRSVRRLRPLHTHAALGCVLLFGVLIMSISLGRAALVEGSILIGLAVALLQRADWESVA
jgi:hypothetical protein